MKTYTNGSETDKLKVRIFSRSATAKELKEKLEGFEKLTGKEPVMFVQGELREANVEKNPDWNMFSSRKVKSVGTKYICVEIGQGRPGDSGYLRKKERYFYPDGIPTSSPLRYEIRAKTKVERKTDY